MEDIRIKDMINGKSGFVSLNYTKLKDSIKRCKEKGDNHACRIALKEIGVEFVDE